MQSRVFDTTDETQVLRSIISAMQDMGMKIEKTDAGLKLVEGSKLLGVISKWRQVLQLTLIANIRPRGKTQILVRVTAFTKNVTSVSPLEESVDDSVVYQNFFTALQKTLFLDAQTINE